MSWNYRVWEERVAEGVCAGPRRRYALIQRRCPVRAHVRLRRAVDRC